MKMMKHSERLDWVLTHRSKWTAHHIESGTYLFASSKSELMTKINAFDHSDNSACVNNWKQSEKLGV